MAFSLPDFLGQLAPDMFELAVAHFDLCDGTNIKLYLLFIPDLQTSVVQGLERDTMCFFPRTFPFKNDTENQPYTLPGETVASRIWVRFIFPGKSVGFKAVPP